MHITNEEIIFKLDQIVLPTNNKKLQDYDYLSSLDFQDDKYNIILKNFTNDQQLKQEVKREITKFFKIELNYSGLKIKYLEQQEQKINQVSEQTQIILIASGKGGVGKSFLTTSIAEKLVKMNYKVGIMDADIYGYSIPKILDLYAIPTIKNEKIIPLKTTTGIEVISTQYFIENNENKSVNWRGPMITQLLEHFFYDVAWDQNLDYLLIDMPPGTGDAYIDIPRLAPNSQMVIITTANKDAAHVAIRCGQIAQQLQIKVAGVIENMSYYYTNNEEHYIFGKDGGKLVSNELNTQLLGKLPITQNKDEIQDTLSEIIEKIRK